MFSYAKNKDDLASLYEMNLYSLEIREVLKAKQRKEFVNAVYSREENKIYFIAMNSLNNRDNEIGVCDIDGRNVKYLTNNHDDIIRIIASDYSDEIIYIKINKDKQPSGMDIFSLDINTGVTNNITESNLYGIFHLHQLDSIRLTTHIVEGGEGGMFIVNRETSPATKTRVVPENNPRKHPALYYNSVFHKESNSLIFEAPYELYCMDMDEQVAKSIFKADYHISDFILSKKPARVFFLIQDGKSQIYSMKIDGSDLKIIPVNIPSENK